MQNELIIKNIINNFVEVMTIATQFSPHHGASVKDVAGSLHYFSGCEFPFFNGVFNSYKNQASCAQDNLSDITNFFTAKNVPFIWWWLQQAELPSETKKELDQRGFQYLGEFSGVAAQLNQINLAFTADNVSVKCVEDNAEYEKFIAIICDVFQLSDSIKKDLTAMFQSYGPQGKFKHYLGFYANKPAATLTTYTSGKIIGLYNGTTLVDRQKHGLCRMLVKSALQEAMDLGCDYAISQLMAPDLAKGLIDRLGFKKYCSLLPFAKDPRAAAK